MESSISSALWEGNTRRYGVADFDKAQGSVIVAASHRHNLPARLKSEVQ